MTTWRMLFRIIWIVCSISKRSAGMIEMILTVEKKETKRMKMGAKV